MQQELPPRPIERSSIVDKPKESKGRTKLINFFMNLNVLFTFVYEHILVARSDIGILYARSL